MLSRDLSPSGSAVGTSGLEFEEGRLVDFLTLVSSFPSLSVSLTPAVTAGRRGRREGALVPPESHTIPFCLFSRLARVSSV